jgi:hypothetical protein
MTTPNIATFQVLDHGEDGSQYFPGCGVANTDFKHVVTGAGDTGADALEDALEQMASGEPEAHPTDAQVAEMRTHLSNPDRSAFDSLDHSECSDDHDGDDWHHYVSIRYTLTSEVSDV